MPQLKTRSNFGLHSLYQRLILWVCEDAFLRREDTVRVGNLCYCFEEFAFDIDRRELHRGAEVVSITPQVFDLLEYLIRNRERVVSKDELINAVWNGRIVSDAALTTRLNAVRAAIGDTGEEQRLIKTLPRKGFRFVGQVRETREVEDPNPRDAPESALALPDKPSIAVLPFENMSGDPEQEYFADGMVEEITTALSRFKWLFVIARNSSFTLKGKAVDVKEVGRRLGVRYILEGSVRVFRHGQRRLTVSGYSTDPQFEREEAERLSRLALRIDDGDPNTLARASLISAYVVRDSEGALEMADRAVALNPNSSTAWHARGWVYRAAGLPQEAVRSFERGIRMSPIDPVMFAGMGMALVELRRFDEAIVAGRKAQRHTPSHQLADLCLASAFAHLGRDAEAREAAARLLEVNPAFTISGWIAFAWGGQSNVQLVTEGLRKAGLPE
jgi:TolB-like protein/Flp pilus assembly protein TadD